MKRDFLPHVEAHFANKTTTLAYYRVQLAHLVGYVPLASARLNEIAPEIIAGFIEKRRQGATRCQASIGRSRYFGVHFILLWNGARLRSFRRRWFCFLENDGGRGSCLRKKRIGYLEAAGGIGSGALEAYAKALYGIRAVQRGEIPRRPQDPFLLRDVSTLLVDCGLRPEECYRMRWEHVRNDALTIPYGKTVNARREIPLSERVIATMQARRDSFESEWVFPAPTRSGHIEQSTLKEAARPSMQTGEASALRAVHVSAYLPNPLGRDSRPLHAGLFGGA